MKDQMKILVPVDGSALSTKAAAFAADFARMTNGSIDLLFVSAFEQGTTPTQGQERFIPVEQLVSSMQGPDQAFLAAKKAIGEDVSVATHAVTGDPGEQILGFSREHGHELIVIGSKGTSAVQGFLIGSVSQKILEASDASVIIVK